MKPLGFDLPGEWEVVGGGGGGYGSGAIGFCAWGAEILRTCLI